MLNDITTACEVLENPWSIQTLNFICLQSIETYIKWLNISKYKSYFDPKNCKLYSGASTSSTSPNLSKEIPQ